MCVGTPVKQRYFSVKATLISSRQAWSCPSGDACGWRGEGRVTGRSTLREDLHALTPRLRRYARALATGGPGPSELADDIVHATLMRAMGSRSLGVPGDRVTRIYATVTQLHREVATSGRQALAGGTGRSVSSGNSLGYPSAPRSSKMAAALMNLSLEDREALILVVVEGFDYADAARILRTSRGQLLGRLTQARAALDVQLGTRHEAVPRARGASHLRLVT